MDVAQKLARSAILLSLAVVLFNAPAGRADDSGIPFDRERGVFSLSAMLDPVRAGIVQVIVARESPPEAVPGGPGGRPDLPFGGPANPPANPADPSDPYGLRDRPRQGDDRGQVQPPVPPDPRRGDGVPPPGGGAPRSSGSGVVIDAEAGLIVTNHHVVDNGRAFTVRLPDGTDVEATLVGSDAATDIGLLKVEGTDLTSVPVGDSESLRVGDVVLAVGYPFGIRQTTTIGIVSGLGRTGVGTDYEDFIQTDAPINQGNSGGALLDSRGRLIGINTAIFSPTGGNLGIGFAVPARMMLAVVGQLREFGEVRRGRLGVEMQAITRDLAQAIGYEGTNGALVTSVEPGSAGAKAGLRTGDIVVTADGQRVDTPSDLRNVVGLAVPERSFQVEVLRDGERLTVDVTLAEPKVAAAGEVRRFGATFAPLPDDHPMTAHVDGLIVKDIEPGSAADDADLADGDIVMGMNQSSRVDAAALVEALRSAQGTVALNVARGNQEIIVVIRG